MRGRSNDGRACRSREFQLAECSRSIPPRHAAATLVIIGGQVSLRADRRVIRIYRRPRAAPNSEPARRLLNPRLVESVPRYRRGASLRGPCHLPIAIDVSSIETDSNRSELIDGRRPSSWILVFLLRFPCVRRRILTFASGGRVWTKANQ